MPTMTGAIMIWYMFINIPTASKGFYKINGVSDQYPVLIQVLITMPL